MSLHFIRLSIAVAALLAIAPAGALAAEHVVKMLNDNGKGEYMVFEPSYIEAAPGDTVKFVAVDQFHNAETMPEIWPEGAATFQGELSKDVRAHDRGTRRLWHQVPAALPDGHDRARGRRRAGQQGPARKL